LEAALRGKYVRNNSTFETAVIGAEEIAPDRDEAQFKGTLDYSTATRAFVVRAVKEKQSGRWRVSYFVAENAAEKAKGPKK
jgi:hypothetical protein